MKLYYSPGACSLSVRIVLNELNVPFESEAVDLNTKKTANGADYFKINSRGGVPGLVLDNNEVLTENIAIQQYLAEHFKSTSLLPPAGDMKRYRVFEFLSYIASDIHKSFAPFFNPKIPADIRKNVYLPALKKHLDFMDQHLSSNSYLVGKDFTLPDAYFFVALSWLTYLDISVKEWKHLSAYVDRIKLRKAVQKSLQEEGLL